VKVRFAPAAISAKACQTKPVIGPLPAGCAARSADRYVRTGSAAFGFAATDGRTLALLEAVWGNDVCPPGEPGDDTRIVCGPAQGQTGRFVDPAAGRQHLAFDYAPFTLIKQAMRWEYGRQSPQSGMMPVHGVIIETRAQTVCVSARGQAGKSFLADTWLDQDSTASVLVDDWSLVEAGTRRIRRTGDGALHVRGTAFERASAQLQGAGPELVELCEGDSRSDETRYLVDRACLPRFANDGAARALEALVLVREPRAERFALRDDATAVRRAFDEEASTFWDDSLIGLPADALEYLRDAWSQLLSSTTVVVMQGHRGQASSRVVEALREALGL
jgi:hypothetical protein